MAPLACPARWRRGGRGALSGAGLCAPSWRVQAEVSTHMYTGAPAPPSSCAGSEESEESAFRAGLPGCYESVLVKVGE